METLLRICKDFLDKGDNISSRHYHFAIKHYYTERNHNGGVEIHPPSYDVA